MRVRSQRTFAGGKWIRTIGPWRQAVGPVMENGESFAGACRAGHPTVRRCGDVGLHVSKMELAWLLCLPVGQASSLASSYRSTLFLAHRPKAGLSARDQGFESVSLQRRVQTIGTCRLFAPQLHGGSAVAKVIAMLMTITVLPAGCNFAAQCNRITSAWDEPESRDNAGRPNIDDLAAVACSRAGL